MNVELAVRKRQCELGLLDGRIGALALAAFVSILELLCFVLRIVVRLLAIPGDVLRGRAMEPAASVVR